MVAHAAAGDEARVGELHGAAQPVQGTDLAAEARDLWRESAGETTRLPGVAGPGGGGPGPPPPPASGVMAGLPSPAASTGPSGSRGPSSSAIARTTRARRARKTRGEPPDFVL